IAKRWRLSAVVAIGLLAAAAANESYWTSIRTILHPAEDYNLTGEEGRVQIWRRGMGYMIQHPVLGVGAGNFPTAEGTISPLAARQQRGRGVKWIAPHNSYIQIGAELGVPGLVAFIGFIVTVFGALRGAPAAPRLAQALTAALIGFAVGAFFLTLAYHEMLYTLAGIAVALRKVSTLPVARVAPVPLGGLMTERPAWLPPAAP
ncbi:MAG: O-antigen ligase family protein, partial [Dehalococcoidia bacterium]